MHVRPITSATSRCSILIYHLCLVVSSTALDYFAPAFRTSAPNVSPGVQTFRRAERKCRAQARHIAIYKHF